MPPTKKKKKLRRLRQRPVRHNYHRAVITFSTPTHASWRLVRCTTEHRWSINCFPSRFGSELCERHNFWFFSDRTTVWPTVGRVSRTASSRAGESPRRRRRRRRTQNDIFWRERALFQSLDARGDYATATATRYYNGRADCDIRLHARRYTYIHTRVILY